MIIPDEILIGAMLSVGGFIGYMMKYTMTEMKNTVAANTTAINALVAVVQRCDRK